MLRQLSMLLLKYFKSAESREAVLPNPDEALACQLPSSTISAANREVKESGHGAVNQHSKLVQIYGYYVRSKGQGRNR